MENIKTYPVVSEWYAQKLPNKVERFVRIILVIALLVLTLVQIGNLLSLQALNSMHQKNIIKYGNELGFQPIHNNHVN